MPVATLHLTNAWHPSSGGRTFYRAMLDAAGRDGRRMAIVVPGAVDAVEDVGERQRIYHVAAPQAPAFDRRYRVIYPHHYLPVVGRRLLTILERERPDLVEICDKLSLPYLAAMLRKRWHPRVPRPALVGLSCERLDDSMAAYLRGEAASRRFARWYIRHIYGPPFDAHIANSSYTAAELRTAMPDRPWDFIRVCPMGVDTAGFSPALRDATSRDRLLALFGAPPSSTLLCYAGRLSPEKNLPLLIETLRHLVRGADGDYRLLIAGHGPQADWLRAQASGELERRIIVCGTLGRQALASCYANCDVFVHPNAREPFGIGPLEAMASGTPVVVPNGGGVITYANASNAWLSEPTPVAFADAVRAGRLRDPRRLQAARFTSVRFSWERITRRYFDLYEDIHAEVLGAPNAARPRHIVRNVSRVSRRSDRASHVSLPVPPTTIDHPPSQIPRGQVDHTGIAGA